MILGHSHLLRDAISLKMHLAPSEGPVGNQSPEVAETISTKIHFSLMYKLLLIPTLYALLCLHFIIFII